MGFGAKKKKYIDICWVFLYTKFCTLLRECQQLVIKVEVKGLL